MAQAQPLPFPDVSIDGAAREAMAEADQDVAAAARLLEQRASGDTALAVKLAQPLMAQACRDACRAVRTEQRAERWCPPSSVDESNARAVRAARARLEGIYDWPLSSGIKLGDAIRDDVEAEAAMYAAQARHNHVRSTFMRLIAEKLTGKRKVRTTLSIEQLSQLQDEAAAE